MIILLTIEGAKVVVVCLPAKKEDIQHTKGQVEKNGGEIGLIAGDLSYSINCTDVAERIKSTFGTVNILVNNAATQNGKGTSFDIFKYVYLLILSTVLLTC